MKLSLRELTSRASEHPGPYLAHPGGQGLPHTTCYQGDRELTHMLNCIRSQRLILPKGGQSAWVAPLPCPGYPATLHASFKLLVFGGQNGREAPHPFVLRSLEHHEEQSRSCCPQLRENL